MKLARETVTRDAGAKIRMKVFLREILRNRPAIVVGYVDSKCWAAPRKLNRCAECSRVEGCKLPEAKQGRRDLLKAKILLKQEQIQELESEVRGMTSQLKEDS